ncbi:SET methyltransferase domain containing protein [Nitzschia inconspicua]|uniref:SET methyltransferase domain containing protein n=1 Tax=Nitzschia inconspicua TaxID=303405 RepID=A0A9K3LAK5_9STRA|nr:SET methyltransferase domain containing protein [Nitzschia inconspicua]
MISPSSTLHPSSHAVPDDCTLVMAPSTIPNAGWGVFTLTERRKNEPLLRRRTDDHLLAYGDLVIQLPDLQHPLGAKKLLWEYLWDARETGGQYEGLQVVSFVPGVAMLANGDATYFNVLPSLQPNMDSAGATRRRSNSSPGIGAFTQYHNFTWYVSKDMAAGDEVFINYGHGWFQERGFESFVPTHKRMDRPTVSKLRDEGYCLDNLRPGLSSIPHAGRGAFAKRNFSKGTVVAPVPVLPISKVSMQMLKQHHDGRWVETQQLLTNYCYGHSQSTLLLCPYSDMVHLINHGHSTNDSTTTQKSANVRLQWSTTHGPQYFNRSMEELQETSTRLMLELVALRDIQEGDEIFLDYGPEWSHSWNQHVEEWIPLQDEDYVPSYVLNQQLSSRPLLTMAEQKTRPYPDNIFTSCYYNLTLEDIEAALPTQHNAGQPQSQRVAGWKHSDGIFEPQNLRPCLLLDRKNNDSNHFYTVRLMNRPGTKEKERLPKTIAFIVTQVPRRAVRFSDKIYTTDQHLETAFRQPIGLDLFPKQWLDLQDGI